MSSKLQRLIKAMKLYYKKRNEGLCPFCSKKVDPNSFKDELSKKELKISGLCQECQDKTFET